MQNGEKAVYKLQKPWSLPDGRSLEEVSIDIDKLNSGDMDSLELEYAAIFQGANPANGIFLTDSKYQMMIIARINGTVYDNTRSIGARDRLLMLREFMRFLALPA